MLFQEYRQMVSKPCGSDHFRIQVKIPNHEQPRHGADEEDPEPSAYRILDYRP